MRGARFTPLCVVLITFVLYTSYLSPVTAQIQDNSFLIEEAYNQERGVVQHISAFARPSVGNAWSYSFTQEWPLGGIQHQLSYTLPVQNDPEGTGLGDIARATRELSRKFGGCWVVLKGHQTVIGRAEGTLFVNCSGSPGLAQGGHRLRHPTGRAPGDGRRSGRCGSRTTRVGDGS